MTWGSYTGPGKKNQNWFFSFFAIFHVSTGFLSLFLRFCCFFLWIFRKIEFVFFFQVANMNLRSWNLEERDFKHSRKEPVTCYYVLTKCWPNFQFFHKTTFFVKSLKIAYYSHKSTVGHPDVDIGQHLVIRFWLHSNTFEASCWQVSLVYKHIRDLKHT